MLREKQRSGITEFEISLSSDFYVNTDVREVKAF